MIVNSMCCSLCGLPHKQEKLEKGWFAENYKKNKKTDSATRLLCPNCADKYLRKP